MLDTFGGKEGLSKGSGVLDIAGGRGNIMFELTTKRNIPCTLIDPRTRRFNKF